MNLRPLADWLSDCRTSTAAEFAARYPDPFLVCSHAALTPVRHTHGLTIDRAMVVSSPADPPTALGDYTAVEVKSSQLSRSVEITIGCSSHCDIQLNDASVSKLHALMSCAADGWHIVDATSLLGTRVNDVEPGTTPLSSGDRLTIGAIDLIFLMPLELHRLVRRLSERVSQMKQSL